MTSDTTAPTDVHVVAATDHFDDDLRALLDEHGFRIDAIFPADAPDTAIVSGHGVRLRLERSGHGRPARIDVLDDVLAGHRVTLPGGSELRFRPFTTTVSIPENRPTVTVSHDAGESGTGRAGMRYRDLIPDRWGGRFISSLISIPDGGPVPDYVHFHKIRFQLIFVKSGWVRVVYEDQGDPFVLHEGDCVIQPPEIRHRVLEASPGLEVVEIGCPAWHETIADHSLELPNRTGDPERQWGGQRFVRHVAAGAEYRPWRIEGWEYRESGVADATDGLAGVRVARLADERATSAGRIAHDGEFAQLVVLRGALTIEIEGHGPERLVDGSAVAVPGGVAYRLADACPGTELLDVTLPAEPNVVAPAVAAPIDTAV